MAMLTVILLLQGIIIAGLLALLIRSFADPQAKRQEFLRESLEQLRQNNSDGFLQNRNEIAAGLATGRTETDRNFRAQSEQFHKAFADFMKFIMEFREAIQKTETGSAEKLSSALQQYGDRNEQKFAELVKTLEEKITSFKTSLQEENRNSRKEQTENQAQFQLTVNQQFVQNRSLIDERLKNIQEENGKKLDEMKKTVDEKLQSSMEKHFNESFKLISERLEQVHKGLGEMQSLAAGVGDLKKVLTNVKTRGNLGEIQLSTILSEYLAPDQYVANISTVPGSSEIVEFAIKMPGRSADKPVYLPVDSKFPVEDYQRLLECYEQYSRMAPEVRKAQDSFARTVKKCASDIHDKYLYPPETTAFGMMFVPSEGIYAEILRLPGLFEQLQSDYKISVVGPSNLVAFLNALQLGFKTLAIEKRSNEVWNILGAVKTEFRKFGDAMDATRKSLQSVCNHVDQIGTRSRALERQLRSVQELPGDESEKLLAKNNAPDDFNLGN